MEAKDGGCSNMWEAIKDVLTNSFGLVALIIIAVFIIILLMLSKKGFFTISTKAVRIGQDSSTRTLISQQLDYIHSYILSLIPSLQKHTKTEYKLRFILSEVEDVFQYAAVFNSMSTTPAYVESKAIKAYGTIIKYLDRNTDDEYFFSEDFKKYVYDEARNIVTGLVELKDNSK